MLPVFDAHCDALQRALDLGHDLSTETPGHFDLPKARRGGVRAIVLTAWIDGPFAEVPGASKRRANALLDVAEDWFAASPKRVRRIDRMDELEALPAGEIGVVLAIEGGHAIENDLDQLAHFARRGVRLMTLTWNNHLPWARSCQPGAGPEIPAGLSDFGRDVVRTMGEVGMLVDLSHAAERTFFDALECAVHPPIVSHSGCRALADHPRNVTDAQLRALAECDGVVGIPFVTAFLNERERAAEQAERERPGYAAIRGANATESFLHQGDYLHGALPPFPIDHVADHVMHALEVAGPRHVAIGSDFDGIQRRPAGLEDASGYPALLDALQGRGVDRETLANIAYHNAHRVLDAVSPG